MPDDAHLPHADGIGSSSANAFSRASDQLIEDVSEHSCGQENAEVNDQVNDQISREVHDAQYQVLWSKTMDKGDYQDPNTYTNIVALLFCWEDHCNDMETKDEVDRLRTVLEDDFNYKTQTEYLDSSPGLQLRVNAKVAVFVRDNDGPNNLLIVYYAGHGRPGKYPGSLILTGQMSPNDRKKCHEFIEWDRTEGFLKPARADVLELFDCCHAAYLGLVRGETKKFEYLAATKEMGGTPVAGKESFTSALIFSLRTLVKEQPEGRFTTMELLKKIQTDAPDFPKNQKPVISPRDTSISAGRIMLHPLKKTGSACGGMQPKADRYSDPARRQVLTLRFYFDQKPSLDRIERLGLEFNTFFEQNPSLGVKCIRWGGLQSAVARFAQPWLDMTRNSLRRQAPDRLVIPERWPSPKSEHYVYPVTPRTPSDNEATPSPQFPPHSPQLLSPSVVIEGQSSRYESSRNSLDLNDTAIVHIQGPHERIEVSHQHSEGLGSPAHGNITTVVKHSY